MPADTPQSNFKQIAVLHEQLSHIHHGIAREYSQGECAPVLGSQPAEVSGQLDALGLSDGIEHRLADFETRTERRLTDFETRIERRLADSVQRRLADFETRIETRIERRLTEFEIRFQTYIERRLAEFETRMDRRLTEFEKETVTRRLTDFDTRVKRHFTKMEDLAEHHLCDTHEHGPAASRPTASQPAASQPAASQPTASDTVTPCALINLDGSPPIDGFPPTLEELRAISDPEVARILGQAGQRTDGTAAIRKQRLANLIQMPTFFD